MYHASMLPLLASGRAVGETRIPLLNCAQLPPELLSSLAAGSPVPRISFFLLVSSCLRVVLIFARWGICHSWGPGIHCTVPFLAARPCRD